MCRRPCPLSFTCYVSFQIQIEPSSSPAEDPPRSYISWSLTNTLCCFCVGQWILLCSLPALVFSCNVHTKLIAGRLHEARNNSSSARFFNLLASLFILLFFILGLAFMLPFYSRNMLLHTYSLYQYQRGNRSSADFYKNQ